MLTHIQFSNYRAFRKGQFSIKPITIFVGANSVGKTSLLQLPLILKQTASATDKDYKAALRLHGREVSIGDPKNFFFNQNTDEDFEINLSFKSDDLYAKLTVHEFNDFAESIFGIIQYYDFALRQVAANNPAAKFPKNFRPLTVKAPYSDQELQELLDFLTAAGEVLAKIPKEDMPVYGLRHLPHVSSLTRKRALRFDTSSTVYVTDVERMHRFLSAIPKIIDGPEFTYTAKISLSDGESGSKYLRVNEIALSQKSQDILRIAIKDRNVVKISSSMCDDKFVNNYHRTLDKHINPASTIFDLFKSFPDRERFQFPELIRSIFSDVQDELSELFDDDALSHIGPLRAYPKRFYFLDIAQAGATEGDLLVENLREHDDLRAKVNGWLARFGIDINVKQLEEIIYRLAVRSKGTAFDLDITDVGFGISQLLPILVEGFISVPGKMIMIEQPEIHLHPKMQSELADLFIDIADLKNEPSEEPSRYLIIETHSEYLLSRLRRRIAEGRIRHSDVALYFIERAKDGVGSTVRGAYMPADGAFEWPEEFFENDLQDTLAFLKTALKTKETPKMQGDYNARSSAHKQK